MRAGKASRTDKVLRATPRDSSHPSLPSPSYSSRLEHKVMLTMTFWKKPIGMDSLGVTGTSDSCSRRWIGKISCLLMLLDFFLPFKWWGLFFIPCLFLRQRGDDCIWMCFLGLQWVTRIHPSSSSSALSETSTKRSVFIKGPLDSIGATTGSKLPYRIIINFSPRKEINSVFTLPWGRVCFCLQGDEEHST